MNTFERVRTIVANMLTINETKVTPDAYLYKDLGADSLGMMEISMAVEEEFGIKIDDEEAYALETVQQIVDCIELKSGVNAGAKTTTDAHDRMLPDSEMMIAPKLEVLR